MLSDCCNTTRLKGSAKAVDKYKAYLLFSDVARPLINPLFVAHGSNSLLGYSKDTLCKYRSCSTLNKKGAGGGRRGHMTPCDSTTLIITTYLIVL